MKYSDGMTKLAMALHYSTPAILAIVLVYAFVVDKTFGLFKLIGEKLPHSLVACMRFFYVVSNAAAVALALFFVVVRCNLLNGTLTAPHALRFENEDTCLPVTTLTAIVTLCALWTDRVVVAFFQLSAEGHSGFRNRILRATTVGCAFMALSKNDPYALLLLLVHGSTRPTGVTAPRKLVKALERLSVAVQAYGFVCGVVALASPASERVASRSAAVLMLAAASPVVLR